MTQDWGPHTWKMFHTLVNKVKPEYFNEVKNDLIYYYIPSTISMFELAFSNLIFL